MCETPFWSSHQNGGPQHSSLFTSLWLVFNCHFYLVMSLSQLTFKPESFLYFHLVLEGGYSCFQWFHTCTEDLGPPGFFLVIFNYEWLTSECFGLTHSGQLPISRISVCFFLFSFFLLLSPSPEIYLSSLNHVTRLE